MSATVIPLTARCNAPAQQWQAEIRLVTLIPWEERTIGIEILYEDGTYGLHEVTAGDRFLIKRFQRAGLLQFVDVATKAHAEQLGII